MHDTQPVQQAIANTAFESDLAQVAASLSRAFARVIEHVSPDSRAVTSLAERLGVHRKLAWQLSKIAYTTDPFEAARHMPTPRALESLLADLHTRVPAGMASAASEAVARFEAVLTTHADTRVEREMLLDSFAPARDPETDARWRQQAFVGNSYTWGAHCRLLLALCILTPSDDRDLYFHAVQVRGLIGFRQTRRAVRWLVNQAVVADDASRITRDLERTPLDPEAADANQGVPLLPEFCSDPPPPLIRSTAPDGMVHDEFVEAEPGRKGERSLVTAEIVRNLAPTHATPNDRVAHFGTAVRTPAEVLHFDLFVHAGLFGDVRRELRVFSDVANPMAFADHDAIDIAAEIERLGTGLTYAHTPDLPAYDQLAESVFTRLNRDPGEYELYRVRVPYPPMPTTVMVRHELLDPEDL